MRAREFTINIPVHISINGEGDPEIDMASHEKIEPNGLDTQPVFVPPLQQELEMIKASNGKASNVINKLTQPVDDAEDELTSLLKLTR